MTIDKMVDVFLNLALEKPACATKQDGLVRATLHSVFRIKSGQYLTKLGNFDHSVPNNFYVPQQFLCTPFYFTSLDMQQAVKVKREDVFIRWAPPCCFLTTCTFENPFWNVFVCTKRKQKAFGRTVSYCSFVLLLFFFTFPLSSNLKIYLGSFHLSINI